MISLNKQERAVLKAFEKIMISLNKQERAALKAFEIQSFEKFYEPPERSLYEIKTTIIENPEIFKEFISEMKKKSVARINDTKPVQLEIDFS